MPADYGLCANIHDEVQVETRPEIAEAVGQAFADCIAAAGVSLNLKCLFAGKASKPGDNWSQTH